MTVLFGRLSLAWVATRTPRAWPRVVAMLLMTLLVACESPEEKEARHYERGVALYEEGQDEKAMVEFRNVLRLNPKNADAIFHVGLIHERGKRFEPAFVAFREATLERPGFIAAQSKLGTTALQLGLAGPAEQAAEAIYKLEPDNPDGLAIKAAVALVDGNIQAALDLAKAALEKNPQHEEAAAMLAGVYSRLGEHERALARISEALSKAPRSKILWQTKLALFENTGDLEGIARTYRELFALEPENIEYRLALANLYRERGDLARAETVLRQAIDSGLLAQETVSALVDLAYQQHGFTAAEAELKRLIGRAPENVELRFRLAELYAGADRSEDAERTLREIVAIAKTAETADGARAEIAHLRVAGGEVDGARKLVEEILAANPDHPKANLIRGAMLVREGNFDEAIRSARTALRRDPAWVPGLRFLAEAHLGKGDRDLAIDALTNVVTFAPTDRRSSELLATLLTQRGDYDTALKVWDHVIRLAPDSGEALRARAEIAITQRNWSEAQANIQWLMKLPDQQVTAMLLAGRLLVAQGQTERSREAFARAQAMQPSAAAPMIGFVRSYLADEDIEGALAYLERRTAGKPDDVMALNFMGELLARQGKITQAQAAFQQAIRLEPANPGPYRELGRALLRAGDANGAVEVYRSGLEHLPNDADLATELGWAYYVAGRPGEAIDTFGRLLQLEPGNEIAANNYAGIVADFRYQDAESLRHALEIASRFRTSDNPNQLDTLGWLHYRSGEYAVATTFLERAVNLKSDEPQLRYHLGMALYQVGQKKRALEELAKAVADGAEYPGIDEARSTYAALETALQQQDRDKADESG